MGNVCTFGPVVQYSAITSHKWLSLSSSSGLVHPTTITEILTRNALAKPSKMSFLLHVKKLMLNRNYKRYANLDFRKNLNVAAIYVKMRIQ